MSTESKHMQIDLVSINHHPAHWHDSLELLAVIKGSVRVKDGFEEHLLGEGDVLVVNANDLHAIDRCEDENLVIILDIDIRHFEKHYPTVQNTIIVCDSNTDKVRFRHQLDVVFLSVLDLFLFLQQHEKNAGDEEIERRGLRLLEFLIENFRYLRVYEDSFASLESTDLHAKTLGGALDYIYKNFTEKITLADISAHVNFSKYYISHLIRTVSGLSFQEYINMLRAENSEKLLLTSAKSIQDIACESGFSDVKYYNKHFARWFHTTPGAHRRNYLAAHSAKEKQPANHVFDQAEAIQRIRTRLTDSGYALPQNEGSVRIDLKSARRPLPGQVFRRFCEFELDLSMPVLYASPKTILDCAKNELGLTVIRLRNVFPLHALPHQQAVPAFRHEIFDLLSAAALQVILSLHVDEAPFRKNLRAEIDDFFSDAMLRYGSATVNGWEIELATETDTQICRQNRDTLAEMLRSVSRTLTVRNAESSGSSAFSLDKISSLPHLLKILTQNGDAALPPLKMLDPGWSKTVFCGESGLMAANGLKKVSYYLCFLLAKLGEEILEVGGTHVLAKSGSSRQLLLFHFSEDNVPFPAAKNYLLSGNDPAASCQLVKYTINQKHGSVFDNWIRFGAPKFLSAPDEALLAQASYPEVEFAQWDAGQTELAFRLEPDTVQLIEIRQTMPR